MFFIYIIQNLITNSRYIGQTNDLQSRIDQHNSGQSPKATAYTKRYPPNWKYIYVEGFSSRTETIKREKWLKTGIGRDFIEELVTIVNSQEPGSDL